MTKDNDELNTPTQPSADMPDNVCQITFTKEGGIKLEGGEDAVRKAYEIWNPYKRAELPQPKTTTEKDRVMAEMAEALKTCDLLTLNEIIKPMVKQALAKYEKLGGE